MPVPSSYDNIPDALENLVEMEIPNQPIIIDEGVFSIRLIRDADSFNIKGKVFFQWVPVYGSFFTGSLERSKEAVVHFGIGAEVYLFLKDNSFHKAVITVVNINYNKRKFFLSGRMLNDFALHKIFTRANRLLFSIPNCRPIPCDYQAKKVSETGISYISRIILKDERITITLDRRQNYESYYRRLQGEGGYLLLYNGELTISRGTLTFDDHNDVLQSLSVFISFLNSARTSYIFPRAFLHDLLIFSDYSGDQVVSSFRYSKSWLPKRRLDNINSLWTSFRKYWKEPDDKNFLLTSIFWYTSSNQPDTIEGGLIIGQVALELIFNWWVVEKKNFSGEGLSAKIRTERKIRAILKLLTIDPVIPSHFSSLTNYKEGYGNLKDSCDTIVQVRNDLVHSDKSRSARLSGYGHHQVIKEAWQLNLFYIELALLRILGYNGNFYNRLGSTENPDGFEQIVPWVVVS